MQDGDFWWWHCSLSCMVYAWCILYMSHTAPGEYLVRAIVFSTVICHAVWFHQNFRLTHNSQTHCLMLIHLLVHCYWKMKICSVYRPYRVSQKSTPMKTCIYFGLCQSSTDRNLPSYLPFICRPICQFWSTYLITCENCNTLCNIYPWILTIHFSLRNIHKRFSEMNSSHYIL